MLITCIFFFYVKSVTYELLWALPCPITQLLVWKIRKPASSSPCLVWVDFTLPIVLKFASIQLPGSKNLQYMFSIPWKNNLHGKTWSFQLNMIFYLFGNVLSWLPFLATCNVIIMVIWTIPLFCRTEVEWGIRMQREICSFGRGQITWLYSQTLRLPVSVIEWM